MTKFKGIFILIHNITVSDYSILIGGSILGKNCTIFFLIFFLAGCAKVTTSENEIHDAATPKVLPLVEELEDGLETYHYLLDTMERGNHELFDKDLIIDFKTEDVTIERGNVVVTRNQEVDLLVTRVIGLPGERVKIEKGQIYINDKKLSAFYGKAHRLGMNKNDYFSFVDKNKKYMKQTNLEEIFDLEMESMTLNNNEYFLIGDDWFRSVHQKANIGEIIGIVTGIHE